MAEKTSQKSKLTIIGRAERVRLSDHSQQLVSAKVDTGADNSCVWASRIQETKDGLQFVLFDEGSEYYTGKVMRVASDDYRTVWIANSFGHREERFVVKLRIAVKGRTIKASFTLANRSRKPYPILLGRRLLTHKFLVDVSQGDPLSDDAVEAFREKLLAPGINEG